jgi:hypothetical protein
MVQIPHKELNEKFPDLKYQFHIHIYGIFQSFAVFVTTYKPTGHDYILPQPFRIIRPFHVTQVSSHKLCGAQLYLRN